MGIQADDDVVREVGEETGCEVRLGRFAGAKLYLDRPEPKLVLYWHMRAIRLGAPCPTRSTRRRGSRAT